MRADQSTSLHTHTSWTRSTRVSIDCLQVAAQTATQRASSISSHRPRAHLPLCRPRPALRSRSLPRVLSLPLAPSRRSFIQYGYVRPPRVALESKDKEGNAGADPPVPSIARLPTRGRVGRQAADSNGDGGRGGGGEGGGGNDHDAATTLSGDAPAEGAEDPSFSGQQEEGSGDPEACREEAAEAAGIVPGRDLDPPRNGEVFAATPGEWREKSDVGTAAAAVEQEGGDVGGAAVTPARVTTASVAPAEPEGEPGSPPTPLSPGLADWEITEVRGRVLGFPYFSSLLLYAQPRGLPNNSVAAMSMHGRGANRVAAVAY